MHQKILIQDLKAGMYVIEITRQKRNVKLASGGIVRSQQEIKNMLDKGIEELLVDLQKSQSKDAIMRLEDHHFCASLQQDIAIAQKVYHDALDKQQHFLGRIAAGKSVDMAQIRAISDSLVEQVLQRPEAMHILTQLKSADSYLIDHGLHCVILLTQWAAEKKIEQQRLFTIGMGTLSMDLGMAKVPLLLAHKQSELSDKERRTIERHVQWSLELIDGSDAIDETGKTIIAQHHERLDGSGYPSGLCDSEISELARMAAIVDTYDSLTTDRPYRKGLRWEEAMTIMETQESQRLDQSLLAEFRKLVGSYPVGSMVRLSDDSIAIVVRQHSSNPARPLVMRLVDGDQSQASDSQVNLLRQRDLDIVETLDASSSQADLVKFLRQ